MADATNLLTATPEGVVFGIVCALVDARDLLSLQLAGKRFAAKVVVAASGVLNWDGSAPAPEMLSLVEEAALSPPLYVGISTAGVFLERLRRK